MIQKQTVYLPVELNEETFSVLDEGRIVNKVVETERIIFTPEQLNEYTANVIKQASVEFANWITYTKKHGGVKPLQEALIQYKLKSTEELFDKYLEMSK